ncbi:MAG: G1 family glutamic endopeptidase, partial [Bryobacteraceae bacterium]
QGAPSGTPLTFKVPPNALSAISFSAAPNVQCSVAPANGSGSGQAFTVYTNDEGTATFYVTPSQASSAAQLVATCSSGNQQTIQIQPVAGAKPLAAPAPSNAATNARLGYTVRPALTGDPMALSNQELVKLKYPWRPDPQKAPGAYASWLKAVSKPATLIPPKTVNVEGRSHGPAQISADASTAPYGPYASPNWSGYVLYAGVNQSPFVFIGGEWNVPALVGAENGTSTFSELAIGLDGEHTNDIVEAGTEQEAIVQDGFTYFYYYPWTQTFPQQQTQAISNLTVNPGDQFYAEVWMADVNGNLNPYGGYANFYFGDSKTGQYTYFFEPITPGTFSGVSAEWILERPELNDGSYSDLANYYYAVMQGTFAEAYDGNYANYQMPPYGGVSYQETMYNGNDILSTVYPINSNTMEFIWSNFN